MNTINEATINLIKGDEGCVLTAYPDPGTKGKPWTIGYGHTGLMSLPVVTEGMVITQEQADAYLRGDLQVAGAQVAKLVTVPLNDNQFGALVSFYFNVGEGTFVKSSVLVYVNQKRFNEVVGRLALYRLGGGHVLNGLVKRRHQEGLLWLTNDPTAASTPVDDTTVAEDTNAVPLPPAQPAQNGKTTIDLPAVGGFVTLMASLSGNVKEVIGNLSGAVGLAPWHILVIAGVGFAGWAAYNKFKKDR